MKTRCWLFDLYFWDRLVFLRFQYSQAFLPRADAAWERVSINVIGCCYRLGFLSREHCTSREEVVNFVNIKNRSVYYLEGEFIVRRSSTDKAVDVLTRI